MVDTRRTLTLSKLRVGIFVLFGLAVLGFLILNATGDFNPFQKKLKLRTRFSAADGLRIGSEVQFAGVRIGKVERVDLLPPEENEEFKVEAIMAVDHELNGRPINERIRTDSTAQLIPVSLLANDKTINIAPGTGKGLPVSENDVLPSRVATGINQLAETGNDLLNQINRIVVPVNEILTKANRGEGTLGSLVNDPALYKNLDSTVRELEDTINKINNGSGTAGKLVNDPALYEGLSRTLGELETISKDLRGGRGTAGKLLSDDALYNDTRAALADMRSATNRINAIADDVKMVTGDLAAGRGSAGKLLKDEQLYEDAKATLARFNSTAARLELILADAQSGKGTLGKILTDETLYTSINQTASNVNQLSSEGTKLIYDFRQNPKKYLRIKVSLF